MKNKRIGLLAALVISFIALICASAGIWVYNVHAQDAAEPVLSGGQIEEEYILGEYLVVPSAQITYGGETQQARILVEKPNGEFVQSSNVLLDQGGVYTIEYRAIFEGALKTVRKEFTVQTPMFSGGSKNTVAVYGEDASEYQTGKKGVNVSLAEGDVLVYNDIIDLNASEGHFLEFMVLPQDGPGTIDLRKLTVNLIDLYNPNNVLTIIVQCYRGSSDEANKWFYDYAYVLTGGQNQTPSGLEGAAQKLHVGNEWGAPAYFSFYGMHGENVVVGNETMKLVYSAEANAVFANGTKIITLDDLNYFEEAWEGFTTGEVKMTIQGEGFSRPIAKLLITRIGMNNLNQTLLFDEDAPEITVDYDGYDEANLPKASKGYSYPVFNATARDKMSGEIPVSATVYYCYESSQRYQLEVVDGMFKTNRAGVYTIEYVALDAYRNAAKKLVTIECEETSADLTVKADEAYGYTTSCKTGELIYPAKIVANGGTGNVKTYATVWSQDGYEIPVDEGFRPENVGTYYVILYAVDMLDKTATYVYELTVEANEDPVFLDDVVLPRYFLAGYNYQLPALSAYDYSDGKKQVSTTVSVVDGDGERQLPASVGNFVADAEGYATIVYTATGKLGSGRKEYKVPVIDTWASMGSIDMSKYFYGDNITAVANDDNVTVTATADTEYQFINPVIAQGFKVQFSIVENEFTCLQLVFTDSENENIQFTIEINKSEMEGQNALLMINGVETKYVMPAGFYDGKAIYFEYDDVNKLLQDDAILKQPIKNADGSLFEGFPSYKLYVTARVLGVTGNASVAWTSLGGQVLSSMDVDSIKPSITVTNDYKSSYSYQEVCEIFPAVAADVLSPETENSLTVYDPSGNVVKDINGLTLKDVPFTQSYFISLQNYGSYSAVYTSIDNFGRKQTYHYAIYVTDNIAPNIVFTGEFKEEVQQWKKVDVAKAVVADNLDAEVILYTYLINPEGVITKIKNGGSFDATLAGVYEVRYISIDSYGNLNLTRYKITVTPAAYQPQGLIPDEYKTLVIGGAILAAAVLIFGVILPISKVQRKRRAKAKALKKFESEYGDIKIDVVAIVCGDDETQEKHLKQLDGMVNRMVRVPEGGKVTKNVNIDREEE